MLIGVYYSTKYNKNNEIIKGQTVKVNMFTAIVKWLVTRLKVGGLELEGF